MNCAAARPSLATWTVPGCCLNITGAAASAPTCPAMCTVLPCSPQYEYDLGSEEYLGPRGLLPLLPVLRADQTFSRLNLSGCGLNCSAVEKLCATLEVGGECVMCVVVSCVCILGAGWVKHMSVVFGRLSLPETHTLMAVVQSPCSTKPPQFLYRTCHPDRHAIQ